MLDSLFENGLGHSYFFDNLPKIMERSHYVNNHVIKKLSVTLDWKTTVSKKSNRFRGTDVKRINAHTINLIRELNAEPEAFAPHPVAPDITECLSILLRL